jgi:hypothetical protein
VVLLLPPPPQPNQPTEAARTTIKRRFKGNLLSGGLQECHYQNQNATPKLLRALILVHGFCVFPTVWNSGRMTHFCVNCQPFHTVAPDKSEDLLQPSLRDSRAV